MKKEPMDLEALKKEAAMRMKGQPPRKGIDTILRPMLKEFLESMLEGEMDAHLAQAAVRAFSTPITASSHPTSSWGSYGSTTSPLAWTERAGPCTMLS